MLGELGQTQKLTNGRYQLHYLPCFGVNFSMVSTCIPLFVKKCEKATDQPVEYILGRVQMSPKQKFWLTHHHFGLGTTTPLDSMFDLACAPDLR